MKLYCARDKKTGKLVNDITNPGRRFWEREGACKHSIAEYSRLRKKYDLELVEFELVEVKMDGDSKCK